MNGDENEERKISMQNLFRFSSCEVEDQDVQTEEEGNADRKAQQVQHEQAQQEHQQQRDDQADKGRELPNEGNGDARLKVKDEESLGGGIRALFDSDSESEG